MTQHNDIFQSSASPDEAQSFFSDFLKINPQFSFSSESEKKFSIIFGNSRFLSRFVSTCPEAYKNFSKSLFANHEKPLAVFQKEIAEIRHTHRGLDLTSLKKYKYQEYLRLTIKELLGLDQRIIYRELSHLAVALVSEIANFLSRELNNQHALPSNTTEFALIGMGKLGGLELNYSSDIDLIAVYSEDRDFAGITSHEIHVKLFSKLGQVLGETDENGFLFRSDWELRPEGSAGTLANSLNSMEEYYQTFGAEWERQAYIKAAVMHQTGTLGDNFLEMMTPFVYRKTLDEATIKSVWEMKSRIVSELKAKRINGINIKLDEGGIRDIEFFIQGFQLLYGGKIPDLRHTNTLEALTRLKQHKLVSAETAVLLNDSYLFLRRLESCLQMEDERQTHTVKTDTDNLIKLARRMGLKQEAHTAANLMMEQLDKVRLVVKNIFHEIYGP